MSWPGPTTSAYPPGRRRGRGGLPLGARLCDRVCCARDAAKLRQLVDSQQCIYRSEQQWRSPAESLRLGLVRMRVAMLTVGTRGDVQPLLALALVLQSAGHDVTLCANDNFQGWVEQHGIRFMRAGCGKLDQSGWREARSFGAFIEHTVRQTGALYETMGSAFYRCVQDMLARDPSVQSNATALVVCTMFTQTLGVDIAEKVGAACVVLKWAPDALPTSIRPPFGSPTPRLRHWLPRSAFLNKVGHYAQLFASVLASERAGTSTASFQLAPTLS